MHPLRAVRAAVPLAALALFAALAVAGCGSDESGTGYGAKQAGDRTATATTPESPPGAATRSCGGTTAAGTSELRVTGIDCDVGRGVVAAWDAKGSCPPAAGASRGSCAVAGYRCLAAEVGKGIAVSCSRPGGSLAFLHGRRPEPGAAEPRRLE